MKTVGIIGGLGPETTSKFYLELISSFKKINKVSYPHILINSIALPFSVEREAIAKGSGEEKILPYLLDAAKKLEDAGANFLVLPCNSLHIFISNIRNSVGIPVLSILEETSKFLEMKKINKVGIIATRMTILNKLYEKTFKKNNIKQIIPGKPEQIKIGKLIYNLVSNRYGNKDREALTEITNSFSNVKVKHIILACTDLQLLMPQNSGIKIYDTMKILADATVKNMND